MDKRVIDLVKQSGRDLAAMLAFIDVETGGRGFDSVTGKIMIQFEPAHFRKKAPYTPSGAWSLNKVEVQVKEWIAFNNAFALNPTAAMESTSIGLGQIMGFHWQRLGYKSVGEMWDDAKKGIDRQLYQLYKFIDTDQRLKNAIAAKDWHKVASIYNGAEYQALALKIGREPYNISLSKAYERYKTSV